MCECAFRGIVAPRCGVVVLPRSGLVAWRGLLFAYRGRWQMGPHAMRGWRRAEVWRVSGDVFCVDWAAPLMEWGELMMHGLVPGLRLALGALWAVRALQRRLRRWAWRRRAAAVAMGLHERLGAGSGLGALGEDGVRLVLGWV